MEQKLDEDPNLYNNYSKFLEENCRHETLVDMRLATWVASKQVICYYLPHDYVIKEQAAVVCFLYNRYRENNHILTEHREAVSLNIETGKSSITALGFRWFPETDQFGYKMQIERFVKLIKLWYASW